MTAESSLKTYILENTPARIRERYAHLKEYAQTHTFGTLDADVVVLDTETTGFSFNHDELMQIAAARMRGKKFGRPRVSMQEEFWRLKEEWEAGRISARQAARCIGVSHITFLNRVHEQNAQIQEIGK